jgi:hypothetical protein
MVNRYERRKEQAAQKLGEQTINTSLTTEHLPSSRFGSKFQPQTRQIRIDSRLRAAWRLLLTEDLPRSRFGFRVITKQIRILITFLLPISFASTVQHNLSTTCSIQRIRRFHVTDVSREEVALPSGTHRVFDRSPPQRCHLPPKNFETPQISPAKRPVSGRFR